MSNYAKLSQITCSRNDFKFNGKKNDDCEPTVVEGYKYKQSVETCTQHKDCKGFGPDTSVECGNGKYMQRNHTGCS